MSYLLHKERIFLKLNPLFHCSLGNRGSLLVGVLPIVASYWQKQGATGCVGCYSMHLKDSLVSITIPCILYIYFCNAIIPALKCIGSLSALGTPVLWSWLGLLWRLFMIRLYCTYCSTDLLFLNTGFSALFHVH